MSNRSRKRNRLIEKIKNPVWNKRTILMRNGINVHAEIDKALILNEKQSAMKDLHNKKKIKKFKKSKPVWSLKQRLCFDFIKICDKQMRQSNVMLLKYQ